MNWKLRSQCIITDRKDDETNEELFYRHEVRRRVTAESDLIEALDFIERLRIIYNNQNKKQAIENFLSDFKN